MLPLLQPPRPCGLQLQPQSPQFQQKMRFNYTQSSNIDLVTKPHNQIEAMPPANATPMIPMTPAQSAVPAFNPATTHPVFFTNSFRKPPFQMPPNAGFNPVATGYVFARERVNSNTKL